MTGIPNITTIESYVTPLKQGVRFEQNDTTQQFALGEGVYDNQGGLWKYVSFSGVVAINSCCWIDETFAALKLVTGSAPASQYPVTIGFNQVAAPSGVSYGWLWTGGPGCGGVGFGIKGTVLISCVKDVPLFATSTAGALDDSSVSHYQIYGLCSTVTEPGTGTNTYEMYASDFLSISGV